MQFIDLWRTVSDIAGIEALSEFISAGGDVNQPHPDSGWSLLHLACEHQNMPLIHKLVESGADLNLRPPCGYPPIFQALDIDIDGAIQMGRSLTFDATRALLAAGADSTVRDNKGRSLREFAAPYGDAVLREFDAQIAPLID